MITVSALVRSDQYLHTPEIYWDNLGDGWCIECSCGWLSSPNVKLAECAGEYDEHIEGNGLAS